MMAPGRKGKEKEGGGGGGGANPQFWKGGPKKASVLKKTFIFTVCKVA